MLTLEEPAEPVVLWLQVEAVQLQAAQHVGRQRGGQRRGGQGGAQQQAGGEAGVVLRMVSSSSSVHIQYVVVRGGGGGLGPPTCVSRLIRSHCRHPCPPPLHPLPGTGTCHPPTQTYLREQLDQVAQRGHVALVSTLHQNHQRALQIVAARGRGHAGARGGRLGRGGCSQGLSAIGYRGGCVCGKGRAGGGAWMQMAREGPSPRQAGWRPPCPPCAHPPFGLRCLSCRPSASAAPAVAAAAAAVARCCLLEASAGPAPKASPPPEEPVAAA